MGKRRTVPTRRSIGSPINPAPDELYRWENTYTMKNILYVFLVVLIPALSIALDEGSFKWGEFKELNESIRREIDNNRGKQKVLAFVNRGPIVFETRKGEEYGYMVDSIVIHDYETNKTFYVYCWDFERENKNDMRGFEPQYFYPRYTDEGIVRVEIMGKGRIDGYILFDSEKPSFQYIPNKY
jgi:hypothetical protein